MPVRLDPLNTPAGLKERLFLHETRAPGYGRQYDRDESLQAMRLMRQAIENRLTQPKLWGAPGATDEIDIITIRSQFGEFASYPKLPDAFMAQVNLIVSLANTAGERRRRRTRSMSLMRSPPLPKQRPRASWRGWAWSAGAPLDMVPRARTSAR